MKSIDLVYFNAGGGHRSAEVKGIQAVDGLPGRGGNSLTREGRGGAVLNGRLRVAVFLVAPLRIGVDFAQHFGAAQGLHLA